MDPVAAAELVRQATALRVRAVDAVARTAPVDARVAADAPPSRPDPTPSLTGQAPPPIQDLAPDLGRLDLVHARLYGRAGTMLLRADRALSRHLLDAFA
ncbi:MAG: hypothetical protein KIT14_12880 [bacterium]|nr:hypothetical protein [bacterium]